jgi:hypothetical protein
MSGELIRGHVESSTPARPLAAAAPAATARSTHTACSNTARSRSCIFCICICICILQRRGRAVHDGLRKGHVSRAGAGRNPRDDGGAGRKGQQRGPQVSPRDDRRRAPAMAPAAAAMTGAATTRVGAAHSNAALGGLCVARRPRGDAFEGQDAFDRRASSTHPLTRFLKCTRAQLNQDSEVTGRLQQ